MFSDCIKQTLEPVRLGLGSSLCGKRRLESVFSRSFSLDCCLPAHKEEPVTFNTARMQQLVPALIKCQHRPKCSPEAGPGPLPTVQSQPHPQSNLCTGVSMWFGFQAFSEIWEPFLYMKLFHKLPSAAIVLSL